MFVLTTLTIVCAVYSQVMASSIARSKTTAPLWCKSVNLSRPFNSPNIINSGSINPVVRINVNTSDSSVEKIVYRTYNAANASILDEECSRLFQCRQWTSASFWDNTTATFYSDYVLSTTENPTVNQSGICSSFSVPYNITNIQSLETIIGHQNALMVARYKEEVIHQNTVLNLWYNFIRTFLANSSRWVRVTLIRDPTRPFETRILNQFNVVNGNVAEGCCFMIEMNCPVCPNGSFPMPVLPNITNKNALPVLPTPEVIDQTKNLNALVNMVRSLGTSNRYVKTLVSTNKGTYTGSVLDQFQIMNGRFELACCYVAWYNCPDCVSNGNMSVPFTRPFVPVPTIMPTNMPTNIPTNAPTNVPSMTTTVMMTTTQKMTTASGTMTTASGTMTTASGTMTTASGTMTTASGTMTTASGTMTTASGRTKAPSVNPTTSSPVAGSTVRITQATVSSGVWWRGVGFLVLIRAILSLALL